MTQKERDDLFCVFFILAMLLLTLLNSGCGGMADTTSTTDVTLALEQPRNWCCEVEVDGFVHLECGSEQKIAKVCYCAGVVGIEGTCHD